MKNINLFMAMVLSLLSTVVMYPYSTIAAYPYSKILPNLNDNQQQELYATSFAIAATTAMSLIGTGFYRAHPYTGAALILGVGATCGLTWWKTTKIKQKQIKKEHRTNTVIALCMAAAKGDELTIKNLLASQPADEIFQLLSTDALFGHTALHYAAQNGRTGAIKLLLEACPEDKIFKLLISPTKQWGLIALHGATLHESTEAVRALLDACPQDRIFELISFQSKVGNTALHYAKENVIKILMDACPQEKKLELLSTPEYVFGLTVLHASAKQGDQPVVKVLLEAYESLIFSASKNNNEVHLKIRRDMAQEVFMALKISYEKLKNDPAVDNQIKAQIQDHISNIFAYCIYSDEKFDTITADDKATLNSQVAALLDGAADTIVPELISDYFKVLTKQSVVKDYTNVTVDDTYIGTPDQLHFEITQQKLANSSFKPSSNNKNEENMKKNLATTNGLFDVEFVFQ